MAPLTAIFGSHLKRPTAPAEFTIVLAAGVDTWSICWYLPYGSGSHRAIEALATQPTRRGRLVEEAVAGHRIGWFPHSRMLYAEGHPAEDRLAPFSELPAAAERVAESLTDLGVIPPAWRLEPLRDGLGTIHTDRGGSGFGGVRRLDTTVDVQRSSAVGRAILSGVAAVEPPRLLRSNVHRARQGRGIETITWEGSAGKVARVYDKGLESASHRLPGERIRFEDQRRFPAGSRPTLAAVVGGYGELLFRNRFEPLRQATKGIVVTTQEGLIDRLTELVETGELTANEAERVAGVLLFESKGVELGSRTTRWRKRKLVARAGVLLADGVMEDVDVDLGVELEGVLEVRFED